MAKQIIYDTNAKEKILAGVNKLERAVSSTLGPCGRNVIIDEYGSIHSTKDGVTVAKSITLKDPFENLGANAIKEVASKSNDKVGDGTTTSTLLAAAIYKNGLKYVNFGSNSTMIKNGIKKASEVVIEYVKKNSTKITSKEDIEKVATVSANGDKMIGTMIAEVMDKIGNDGTIKVENGNGTEMTSKIVEGMVIDQSYASPYMVTNSDTMEAELENPFVLIANKKLANIQELLPSLQSISQTGRPIFVIADDFAEDILATMVMNKLRGLNICAIKSPSFGDNRKQMLEDIAILCGGKVISDETGVKVESAVVGSDILGEAKRIVVNKENTVIFDGNGDDKELADRAQSLRAQIKACQSDYDKEKLQERLAKLTSGIGVISVGASTEAERKELRDRVDDAFSASKAALREGVVAGGGSTLLHAKKCLETHINGPFEGGVKYMPFVGDEKIGATILLQSLESPIKKILQNAGLDASYILNKILENDNTPNAGYNVVTGQYVDMIQDGILDPTEVVINEVQNASSIAGLLLTTDALIVEEPAEKGQSCSCQQSQMPMM